MKRGGVGRRSLLSPATRAVSSRTRPRGTARRGPHEWLNRTTVQDAIDAGVRHPPPRAVLGAAHVHAARAAAQAAPRRSLCARRTSRRHQRAVVLVDDQRRQRPGHAAGRGPQLRAARRRQALPAEGRGRGGRRSAHRIGGDAARRRLEPALQVLRQPGADSSSHAPERRGRQAGRPARQARGVLLSAAVQPARQQFSLHVHGARAGHDEGRRAALPRELEQGRQRHPLPVARLQAAARDRLADRSRHPARARLARHLRAAGEQRRLRDVPVRGRRAHHRLEPADQGRAAGAAITISTTSSACSTGTRT